MFPWRWKPCYSIFVFGLSLFIYFMYLSNGSLRPSNDRILCFDNLCFWTLLFAYPLFPCPSFGQQCQSSHISGTGCPLENPIPYPHLNVDGESNPMFHMSRNGRLISSPVNNLLSSNCCQAIGLISFSYC